MDNDNLNENIINEENTANESGVTVKEIPVEAVTEVPAAEEVSVQEVPSEEAPVEAPVETPAEEITEVPVEEPVKKSVKEPPAINP